MKLTRQALLAAFAAAGLAAASAPGQAQDRAKVERTAAAAAPAATFSAEVPLVQRSTPPGGGQSGTLVLNSAHSFNVTLLATNQHNGNVQGAGVALPQTDIFGYFSLPSITNNASNPEVFVKILDARTVNGNYWVFFGHLTDLIYDLTVRENATGRTKTYHKDAGVTAGGAFTSDFPGVSFSPNTEDALAPAITPNSFVRTAIDISNNTNGTISANIQYTYTCSSSACSPVNEVVHTNPNASQATISLPGLGTFHQDDIVQYLAAQGLLKPGADQGSTGTFLVTFSNVPSNIGWEANVQARTYNRVSEVDPLRGTVGFGENGSLFFESTNSTLVGTARDTRTAPTPEGSLMTTVGIRNTDVFSRQTNVDVDLTLYDPATGQRVGSTVALTNIQPGEVRLVNDLFTVAGVPASVHSVILFADTHNHPSTAPTIEGFLLTQETSSLDTHFNELKCADLVRCGP